MTVYYNLPPATAANEEIVITVTIPTPNSATWAW